MQVGKCLRLPSGREHFSTGLPPTSVLRIKRSKRIMIKLFRTYDSGIINSCMSHFNFPTVSELVGQRINRFPMKRNLLDNILFKVCQLL